jgi:hypothetical protein
MMLVKATAAALLAATSALLAAAPVRACAVALPRNTNKPVEIADESAIIIWDAKAKKQHFIRRATFKTEVKDFGFLVPTPTEPKLEEASDDAFTYLAKITEPRVVTQPRPKGGGGCMPTLGCASAPGPSANKAPAVRVLQSTRVAGLDAVTLEADKGKAAELAKWLKDHQYEFSPALADWAQPYLAEGWKITAFKYAKDRDKPEEKNISSAAVRMTFATDQPYFPYREPAEAAAPETGRGGRLLRVFFIGEGRFRGVLGKGKDEQDWRDNGKVVWANKLDAEQRSHLAVLLKLPAGSGPAEGAWLTEIEDHSSPRPGKADVYFVRDATNQEPAERKPHTRYVHRSGPGCVMGWALAVCLLAPPLLRRVRRRVDS